MTTYINFAPSQTASPPFQAQITLDGQQYNLTTTWNLYGQRWYVNVFDLSGNLVVSRAMVGSPTGIAIETQVWSGGVVSAETTEPHGYSVGSIIELTIAGTSPDDYNGVFDCFITGLSTFAYDLASVSGIVTAPGTASYNISLVGGISNSAGSPFSSTLVFRAQSGQFEVSP